MGFQQGLSGLNGAAKNLDVIGNNIANTSTIGFKGSRTEFADVYANSLYGAAGGQAGIGSKVAAVAQQFSQGNLSQTSNPLDVAINGNGFFRMSQGTTISYSRNGQFHLDRDGYVVNSTGQILTGYKDITVDDVTGKVTSATNLGDLKVDFANAPPKATGSSAGNADGVKLVANLDARKPALPSQASILVGTAAPVTLAIATGTNDVINFTVDGVAASITIPAAPYGSNSLLATAIQTQLNTALAAASPSPAPTVTVTADATGILTVTSLLTGATPSSPVTITGGNGASNAFGAATATGTSTAFGPAVAATYSDTTSFKVYDSLGNDHTLSVYFRKVSDNTWDAYLKFDVESAPTYGITTGANPRTLTFDTGGKLTSGTLTGIGAAPAGADALDFALDLTGTTQFGSSFGVTSLAQNGYAQGNLANVTVSEDGYVQGRYTNGVTQNLGQVTLVSFNNTQGLAPIGNNQWLETYESGQPTSAQAPGSGTLGLLQAGTVEEANVDLTAELVNMIVAQRMYQANAQTIKTQDAILQTLVNLR